LNIGRKVRQERLKRGWTLEALAEKVDMNASFIGQIERGDKTASFDTLDRLSAIFGMNTADFLKEGGGSAAGAGLQPMEQKVLGLLKGYNLAEQKTVYETMKYMLRQTRKMAK